MDEIYNRQSRAYYNINYGHVRSSPNCLMVKNSRELRTFNITQDFRTLFLAVRHLEPYHHPNSSSNWLSVDSGTSTRNVNREVDRFDEVVSVEDFFEHSQRRQLLDAEYQAIVDDSPSEISFRGGGEAHGENEVDDDNSRGASAGEWRILDLDFAHEDDANGGGSTTPDLDFDDEDDEDEDDNTLNYGDGIDGEDEDEPGDVNIDFEDELSEILNTEPAYNNMCVRVETFRHWPLILSSVGFDAETMSKTGLYYSGCGDIVRCNFCRITIREWKVGDDIIARHKNLSPNCKHVTTLENVDNVVKHGDSEVKKDESTCICDNVKCKICFDRQISCIIFPCLHSLLCLECATNLSVCPFCRKKIEKVSNLYFS
jgi:hypothetical protein